jgi:DNA-binding transcriptional LysR family regulator
MFLWDDARYFLAVHRTGSLAGAGRTLKVDASTVGRRIRALETALGARLFDRAERLVLTPPGEAFLARAEQIEEAFQTATLAVSGHESRLTGTLRVTAPASLGAFFFLPLIAAFERAHPEVVVELVGESRRLNLTRREADVAIRAPKPTQGQLVITRLGDVGSGLFASRGYLQTKGTPRGLDFAGHDFIGFDETFRPEQEYRWLTENLGQGRIRMTANSAHMIAAAVAEGLGLGIFPCVLAPLFPELVQVRPANKVAMTDLWLVVHPELRTSARVRAFMAFMEKVMPKHRARLEGATGTVREA